MKTKISNFLSKIDTGSRGYWCFFSVNQLENNDTSGNKESAVYCLLTYKS